MSTEAPPADSPASPASSPGGDSNNLVAILSYLTIVGLIVALVMHNSNKTALGAYHLRQALGLLVIAIAVGIAFFIIGLIPFINLILVILAPLVSILFLVLFILGLISAIKGQQKPLPLVGDKFQSWFANAFV